MAQSSVSTFADPYALQDALQVTARNGQFDFFVRERGNFSADLTKIDLNGLWIQQVRINLPYLLRVVESPERPSVGLLLSSEHPPVLRGNREFTAEHVGLFRDAVGHSQTQGPSWLSTMSFSRQELVSTIESISGRTFSLPSATTFYRPRAGQFTRLRALHRKLGELATCAPDTLSIPRVATALEQALRRSMVACITTGSVETTVGSRQHMKIIKRFEDFLTARHHQPVYLAEICAAIGAPERTLRACCQEHLGMGPVRYLWLRRMHLVRRALMRADPATSSVTTVATDHGFWELGRFSVEYRALFGESPRDALRRPFELSSYQTKLPLGSAEMSVEGHKQSGAVANERIKKSRSIAAPP